MLQAVDNFYFTLLLFGPFFYAFLQKFVGFFIVGNKKKHSFFAQVGQRSALYCGYSHKTKEVCSIPKHTSSPIVFHQIVFVYTSCCSTLQVYFLSHLCFPVYTKKTSDFVLFSRSDVEPRIPFPL